MDQAVLAAHEVHERTEIDQVDDLAVVDLADLGLLDQALDPLDRGLDLRGVGGRHLDDALVVDVDLRAGGRDDLADHLAAGADHFADLRLVDREGLDPRRVRRQLAAGLAQCLRHLAQDVRAAVMCLCQRDLHDLLGDAGDLDVHLKAGDALRRARHLEVHVAQMILVAQDVAEHREVLAFQDQAHRDAADRALDRHARVHQAQRTAADRRHRRRAVALRDVAGDADRVGELLLRRQHRVQRAPRELAVADVATRRRAEAAHFADRIGREVVVQHEVLVRQAVQPVDHLLRIAGAQRGRRDRLRLPAGEQRRSVRARQEVDLRRDRANRLGVAAVDTLAGLQDRGADDLRLQLLHQLQRAEILGRILVLQVLERLARLGAGGVDRGLAGLLVGQLVGRLHVLADQLLQLGLGGGLVRALGQLPRVLGGLLGQVDDRVDHVLRRLVREHHRAQHHVLGQLLGFRFDHHHRVVRGGDHQVQLAGRDVGVGRVEDVLAVLVAHARGADRAHEGHARQRHRGRGGDHREQIGLVLAVIAHHLRDAVDLVVEAFGEQRAQRAVDQAADQRLTLGRAALALEEAAGDPAAGGEFLLIVDGQREEVLPFLDGLRGGDGA